jgi:hypothetical protein
MLANLSNFKTFSFKNCEDYFLNKLERFSEKFLDRSLLGVTLDGNVLADFSCGSMQDLLLFKSLNMSLQNSPPALSIYSYNESEAVLDARFYFHLNDFLENDLYCFQRLHSTFPSDDLYFECFKLNTNKISLVKFFWHS